MTLRPSLLATLTPLLAAECGAEAAAAGVDAEDLEQAVWLRFLERVAVGGTEPERPADWLRRAVRAEARRARRERARALRFRGEARAETPTPEHSALTAERHRTVRAAVRRTPGHCPRLLTAMLHPGDPSYRDIAGALGISQGSLGPMRSRCLGCLRRMLSAEVPGPGVRGRVP
ncbi:sigma-70 family RNA polymerase sigma factor [Streptomyces sp. NPDC046203]|uniref:sigma-70 family RNA polymerase sigma factor n=1 Tax=Streptomyces sp. NPDC046203 TaxID=3154602 RepID=UPI0033C8378C